MPKKPPALSRHAVTAPTEDQGTRLPGARTIPIELVRPNPWQPRQHANEERMQELIDDVAARGILEPIIVRPVEEGRYEVVAGERRYKAALAAHLPGVPVIIRSDMSEDEAREVSLVENLLREDLDIEDEARFIKALYEQKKSLRSVGDAIRKSYQYVNRRLKLLEEPQTILDYKAGLVKLDELIAGGAQGEDVPMSEAGTVTERNSTESRNVPAAEEPVEEVRFYRTRSAFKPFHKLQLHVRHLEAASIPAAERPKLRLAVQELISELSRLEKLLDEEVAETNEAGSSEQAPGIELAEREDGRPGLVVRHTPPQAAGF